MKTIRFNQSETFKCDFWTEDEAESGEYVPAEVARELISKLDSLFESISCLCAEGPEFFDKLTLVDAIQKEAMKGCDLARAALAKAGKEEG